MSQFDALIEPEEKKKSKPKKKGRAAKKVAVTPPPEPETVDEKPLAKSKNPDFLHTSVFLKIKTHKEVKKALIDDSENRDLSELVEELLSQWISK